MTFTYTPGTGAISNVRMLIPDRVVASAIFTDDEITAFLTLEGSNVKRAAALALESIGSDQAQTLKVISVLGLSTNGAQTSDALLRRAAQLREQALFEESQEDGGAFDVAEQVQDQDRKSTRLNSSHETI
jgi:hypothetical protein